MAFAGFPRDTLYTPTPDPLFGPLLEEIHDIAELKVTLRGLWLLHHKRQPLRVIALDEFLADTALLRGLRPSTSSGYSVSPPPEGRVRVGVNRSQATTQGKSGAACASRCAGASSWPTKPGREGCISRSTTTPGAEP